LLGTLQVLIAEDDVDAVELYRVALEARGHVVTITLDGRECVNVYTKTMERLEQANRPSSQPYDAVILDYKMPIIDGLEAAKEIIRLNPKQRIIFVSAYVKETLMDSVRELNQVTELVQKPFEPDVLVDMIEDTSTVSRLGELNQLVNQISVKSGGLPDGSQFEILMQLLKKIQKTGTI
jgi:CheY-like chemotaxis protein